MNKNKKYFQAILYIFYLVVIVFVLTEILLWVFFPLGEHYIAIRYSQNIPGLKKEITNFTNHYGFRSLSMKSAKKSQGSIRIICLGASSTEQPTQNIEDTWSGILERKLNDVFSKKNIKIEVAAFGEGGWTTWRGYEWCKDEISKLDPDIVINLWGINDLVLHGGPGYFYEGKQRRLMKIQEGKIVTPWIPKLKITINRYSQICRRLRLARRLIKFNQQLKKGYALEWLSKNLPQLRDTYMHLPYKDELTRNPNPIMEFSDGLEALISLLKERGIEIIIIMGQPTLWKKDLSENELSALWLYTNSKQGPLRMSGAWLEKEMRKYNRLQKELAEKKAALYIPLDSLMPKDLTYFFDDCHFTDKGNFFVASEIYPFVLAEVEKVAKKKELIK